MKPLPAFVFGFALFAAFAGTLVMSEEPPASGQPQQFRQLPPLPPLPPRPGSRRPRSAAAAELLGTRFAENHEPAVPIDDAELDRYLVDQASPIGLATRVAPAIGLDRSPAYVERAGSFPGSSTLDIGWGPDPILPHAVLIGRPQSFALDWPDGEVRRPYSATTCWGESACSRRLRFRIDLPQLAKIIFPATRAHPQLRGTRGRARRLLLASRATTTRCTGIAS